MRELRMGYDSARCAHVTLVELAPAELKRIQTKTRHRCPPAHARGEVQRLACRPQRLGRIEEVRRVEKRQHIECLCVAACKTKRYLVPCAVDLGCEPRSV